MPKALVLLLALAACTPTPRSADAIQADMDAAHAAGDGDRAFALLKEAAATGELYPLGELATARERGYLRLRLTDGTVINHPVRSLPGQAALTRRAFERALAAGAHSGQPQALLDAAQHLVGDVITVNGEVQDDLSPAVRDSARAIYRRIAGADVPQLALALLARRLGDEDAYRQHLDAAVAAAEPQACTFRLWFSGTRHDLSTPAGYADYLDAVEACPRAPDAPDPAAEDLGKLAALIRDGNEATVAFVEGLRDEGVFERHPRLEAFLDPS